MRYGLFIKLILITVMFQYTKNNHIATGKNSNNEFTFQFGKIKTHSTWRKECLNVAEELYDIHGKNLILFLSGGVDSEVMLNSFVALKIKPKVVVLKYEKNNNLHDINYIFRALSKYYISPTLIEVDVNYFYKNKLIEFANKTLCSSPQMNLIMYHAYHTDGIPVLGTGENFLTRKFGKPEVFDLEMEKESRLYSFFQKENRECIPAFFQYTPEQMVSFIQKEFVYKWAETAKKNNYFSSKKIKHEIIAEDFDIEMRPKLTGFELMMDIDNEYRSILENNNYNDNGEQYTSFENYIKEFGVEPLRPLKYEC